MLIFWILIAILIQPFDPSGLKQLSEKSVAQPTAADTFGTDYIMGRFDPAKHRDFVVIPPNYRDETVRYLRKDAMKSFADMADAAAEEGIRLVIRSATRNFENQKQIWEKKWNGITRLEDGSYATDIRDEFMRAKKILAYSSMPGTSRHHWGTDIDINAFENSWFAEGEGAKLYKWMKQNAYKFGFCQVYGPLGKIRKSGYEEEKWHWSYLPVARKITDEVTRKMKNKMISGFAGCQQAEQIDMVNAYMLSIDNSCR